MILEAPVSAFRSEWASVGRGKVLAFAANESDEVGLTVVVLV